MKYALLKEIITELQTRIAGARISKIHQPEAEVLVLRLWNGTANLRLLVSVKSGQQRIHLSQREWLNPHQPPRFCQLLRSRLSRIDRVQLVNDDRVVRIDCHGPKGPCFLMVEMIGTIGNMILVDQHDIIIDGLKRDRGVDSGRLLLAGKAYSYPDKPKGPIDPAQGSVPLPENFTCWSDYLDQQGNDPAVVPTPQGIQLRLRQTIVRQQKKLNKRYHKISAELERQQQAQEDRIRGDLLLANLHLVKKGMEQLSVANIFSDRAETLDILLDTRLSPQQNAQSYFKKYKKAARGVDHSRRRHAETKAELQWLDELLYQLDDHPEPADLEAIYAELDDAGLLKGPDEHHKKRTRQASAPQELVSPSGIKVLRGRNNQQNDQLSGRQLKTGDLWFHANGCPGAHVVLKASTVAVPVTAEDISYAASIAAGYSKAQNDAKVEVMMATAESVSRPKGARPGLVTVKKYQTLIAAPLRP
ncbi:Rqc2 family fibronectin-binding protein [Pelovirga terrestris]|uniref:NFACT family protein n=1 Tax=Pelovirga terrestris TaxID=2771352 RepID=A0A8J6R4S8_9BACT|nr:NFACT family protein [Pelovirga terrestris]MBD1399549.1 NFACT family protein [Pelovirga terrestris]